MTMHHKFRYSMQIVFTCVVTIASWGYVEGETRISEGTPTVTWGSVDADEESIIAYDTGFLGVIPSVSKLSSDLVEVPILKLTASMSGEIKYTNESGNTNTGETYDVAHGIYLEGGYFSEVPTAKIIAFGHVTKVCAGDEEVTVTMGGSSLPATDSMLMTFFCDTGADSDVTVAYENDFIFLIGNSDGFYPRCGMTLKSGVIYETTKDVTDTIDTDDLISAAAATMQCVTSQSGGSSKVTQFTNASGIDGAIDTPIAFSDGIPGLLEDGAINTNVLRTSFDFVVPASLAGMQIAGSGAKTNKVIIYLGGLAEDLTSDAAFQLRGIFGAGEAAEKDGVELLSSTSEDGNFSGSTNKYSSSTAISLLTTSTVQLSSGTDTFYFYLADDVTTSNIVPACGTFVKVYIHHSNVTPTVPEDLTAADWSDVDAAPVECDSVVSRSSVELKWGSVAAALTYNVAFTETFPSNFSGDDGPLLKFSFTSNSAVTIFNKSDTDSYILGYSFYFTGTYFDNSSAPAFKIGAFASNQVTLLCDVNTHKTTFGGSGGANDIYNDFFLGTLCDTTTVSETNLTGVSDFAFYITGDGGYYQQCGATAKGLIEFQLGDVSVAKTSVSDFASATEDSVQCGCNIVSAELDGTGQLSMEINTSYSTYIPYTVFQFATDEGMTQQFFASEILASSQWTSQILTADFENVDDSTSSGVTGVVFSPASQTLASFQTAGVDGGSVADSNSLHNDGDSTLKIATFPLTGMCAGPVYVKCWSYHSSPTSQVVDATQAANYVEASAADGFEVEHSYPTCWVGFDGRFDFKTTPFLVLQEFKYGSVDSWDNVALGATPEAYVYNANKKALVLDFGIKKGFDGGIVEATVSGEGVYLDSDTVFASSGTVDVIAVDSQDNYWFGDGTIDGTSDVTIFTHESGNIHKGTAESVTPDTTEVTFRVQLVIFENSMGISGTVACGDNIAMYHEDVAEEIGNSVVDKKGAFLTCGCDMVDTFLALPGQSLSASPPSWSEETNNYIDFTVRCSVKDEFEIEFKDGDFVVGDLSNAAAANFDVRKVLPDGSMELEDDSGTNFGTLTFSETSTNKLTSSASLDLATAPFRFRFKGINLTVSCGVEVELTNGHDKDDADVTTSYTIPCKSTLLNVYQAAVGASNIESLEIVAHLSYDPYTRGLTASENPLHISLPSSVAINPALALSIDTTSTATNIQVKSVIDGNDMWVRVSSKLKADLDEFRTLISDDTISACNIACSLEKNCVMYYFDAVGNSGQECYIYTDIETYAIEDLFTNSIESGDSNDYVGIPIATFSDNGTVLSADAPIVSTRCYKPVYFANLSGSVEAIQLQESESVINSGFGTDFLSATEISITLIDGASKTHFDGLLDKSISEATTEMHAHACQMTCYESVSCNSWTLVTSDENNNAALYDYTRTCLLLPYSMDLYSQQPSETTIENDGASYLNAYVSGPKNACNDLYLNYITPTAPNANSLLEVTLNSAKITTTLPSCGEHGYDVAFKGYQGVPYSATASCTTIVGPGAKVAHSSSVTDDALKWWADATTGGSKQWIEFVIQTKFEVTVSATHKLVIDLTKFIDVSDKLLDSSDESPISATEVDASSTIYLADGSTLTASSVQFASSKLEIVFNASSSVTIRGGVIRVRIYTTSNYYLSVIGDSAPAAADITLTISDISTNLGEYYSFKPRAFSAAIGGTSCLDDKKKMFQFQLWYVSREGAKDETYGLATLDSLATNSNGMCSQSNLYDVFAGEDRDSGYLQKATEIHVPFVTTGNSCYSSDIYDLNDNSLEFRFGIVKNNYYSVGAMGSRNSVTVASGKTSVSFVCDVEAAKVDTKLGIENYEEIGQLHLSNAGLTMEFGSVDTSGPTFTASTSGIMLSGSITLYGFEITSSSNDIILSRLSVAGEETGGNMTAELIMITVDTESIIAPILCVPTQASFNAEVKNDESTFTTILLAVDAFHLVADSRAVESVVVTASVMVCLTENHCARGAKRGGSITPANDLLTTLDVCSGALVGEVDSERRRRLAETENTSVSLRFDPDDLPGYRIMLDSGDAELYESFDDSDSLLI